MARSAPLARARVAVSLCAVAALAVPASYFAEAGPDTGPPGDRDVRTFDVRLDDANGLSTSGRATATVVDENEQKRSFTITREVEGATSGYTAGTAEVDKQARTMTVRFEGAAGILKALSGSGESAESPHATIPIVRDQYAYSFSWSDPSGSYTETWTERSHTNPDITIDAPDGVVPAGGSLVTAVTLDATVKNRGAYARVELCVDEQTVGSFEQLGRIVQTKGLGPGEHRFVVKVFGPPTRAHPHGDYLGEAERVFVVAGMTLTPPSHTEVDPRIVVEAQPIALEGVASIKFFVDGQPMLTARKGPWAAKLELPHTNAGHHHTISAFAYDAHGKILARASSQVTVRPAPANQPHAPMKPSASSAAEAPGVKGKPAITSFPADPKNYGGKRAKAITTIVMHKTEGPTLEGAVNWFHNPAAHAAAHYVVDDKDVVQAVQDDHVAWHAGNKRVNDVSLGIEVTGYHDKPVSEATYQNAARLVAWLCKKHGIAPSAETIIGHADVPDPIHPGRFGGSGNHEDPGRHPNVREYWDWEKFLGLVEEAYSALD